MGKRSNQTSLAIPRRRDSTPKLRNYRLNVDLTAAQPGGWSGWKGRPGRHQSRWVLGQTDDARPHRAHGPSLLWTSQPWYAGKLLGFGGHSPSASHQHCLKGSSEARNGGSCCHWIHSPVVKQEIVKTFMQSQINSKRKSAQLTVISPT